MNRSNLHNSSTHSPSNALVKTVTIASLAFVLAALADIGSPRVQAASNNADAALCFTQNLYFEARSEGREGMIAVGWVVLNRVDSDRYPDSICGVIYDGGERSPCEFNWWCDGMSDRPAEPESWELAQEITDLMLNNPPADPTDGALWFHMDSIEVPDWLMPRERTLHLGAHYFYK